MLAAFFPFLKWPYSFPGQRLMHLVPMTSSAPHSLLALLMSTNPSDLASNVTFLDTSDQLRPHVNILSTPCSFLS